MVVILAILAIFGLVHLFFLNSKIQLIFALVFMMAFFCLFIFNLSLASKGQNGLFFAIAVLLVLTCQFLVGFFLMDQEDEAAQ